MEQYKYSFFARMIYRYGNIPATFLLAIHLITTIFVIAQRWYFIFLTILNALVIWILNRFFLKTYKLFPFNILADNEKIICTDFFLSKKQIIIRHKDIDQIKGGIFSGYPTRPIYIHDGKQNITIGFYSHVGNLQKLLTNILRNIHQELYNNLLGKIKTQSRLYKK